MPQPRPPRRDESHCDFCGQDKDDVPLLIVSNATKAAICSWCALTVVNQTFGQIVQMEALLKQHAASKPAPLIAANPTAVATGINGTGPRIIHPETEKPGEQ